MALKITLISVLDGIDNLGLRKLAAHVRRRWPQAEVCFVVPGRYRGLSQTLLMTGETDLVPQEVSQVASHLATADVVGFSSMTGYAGTVRRLIRETKRLSPTTFIIWGGIHPIMDPDDAIAHADAVCTSEGELPLEMFLDAYSQGQDYRSVPGMWFREASGVRKNCNPPLLSGEEMATFPTPLYAQGEMIFKKGEGFVPMSRDDFVRFNGVSYPTIWTIGCPFRCSFCGNSKFIDYDQDYRKIRHPGIDYVIAEIKAAMARHPHLSSVIFHDDSMMALKTPILREFADRYRQEVGLPFFVAGVIPNYVSDEKMRVLLAGGMNRVRMGVQSGSKRILEFYQRPTPVERIVEAATIINRHVRYMIPPAFDFILDNPVETTEDTLATIDLLYDLPRPYTLNFFSLRAIPNTALSRDLARQGVQLESINANYWKHVPSFGNCLIYLLVLWRIPRRWFEALRPRVLPSHLDPRRYPGMLIALRLLYLTRRALQHLRHMDFTTLSGRPAFLLWRLGVVGWWRRHMIPVYDGDAPHAVTRRIAETSAPTRERASA